MKRIVALAAAVMMTAAPSAFAVQQVTPGTAGLTDEIAVALPNVNNSGPAFTESSSSEATIYVNCTSRIASVIASGFVNNYTTTNQQIIALNNPLSTSQANVSPTQFALSSDSGVFAFITVVCPNVATAPTVFYSVYQVSPDLTPGFGANDRQAYASLFAYYTF